MSRDEANIDSDIDFLAEFNRQMGFQFFEIQDYLEEILGCPVDLGRKDSLKEKLRATVEKEVINVITVGTFFLAIT